MPIEVCRKYIHYRSTVYLTTHTQNMIKYIISIYVKYIIYSNVWECYVFIVQWGRRRIEDEVKWIMLDHLKKIIKSLDSLPTFLNLFKNHIIAHRYMGLFLRPTSYYQFCLYWSYQSGLKTRQKIQKILNKKEYSTFLIAKQIRMSENLNSIDWK